MTGLVEGTTYYVCAYATNSTGTAYGSVVSFSTLQIPSYIIDVSASPSSGGTVVGAGIYQQGQSCTVHTTPNSGYAFLNWTEGGSQVSTNANYTFTVNSNRTLVANFQLQTAMSYTNHKQNKIIKIFSVAAVVFMPPTWIASVYGMNFSVMPELDWRYGYPISIAMMILSASITYLFFKRRKWL